MKMSFLQFSTCLCILVLAGCQSGSAKVAHNWFVIPGQKPAPCQITVDPSGHGDFSKIQSAVNAIPAENKKWVCIFVKAGTYREKVNMPYDKPFIYLKGEGRKKTVIDWDDHASTSESATFSTSADNIVVSGINFVNSYNIWRGKTKNPMAPALAAIVSGDKVSFYNCGFYGVQDTLCDSQGRHYFNGCTISGAVDFIFGTGQSIYEDCNIHVVGDYLEAGLSGFITAQGRGSPKDENGFVFKGGTVYGTGSAYLGRPWRDYARVLFYKTQLTKVVKPEGWDAWHSGGREKLLTLAEDACIGEGSVTSRRVKWEKKLSTSMINQLTSLSFIDTEGWLPKQPR